MQTAHALALSALSSLIERADAFAQHGNKAKKGEANNEKEKGEGHRSVLVCGKEAEANGYRDQTGRSKEVLVIEVAQYGYGRAEVGEEDSREAGHLGLGFLLGAARLGPLEIRASLFTRNASELLEGCGASMRHEPLLAPLIHGLFADAELPRYSGLSATAREIGIEVWIGHA